MKEDKGALFMQLKDGSLMSMVYMKTNYIRKLKPEPMLMSFVNFDTGLIKKRHAPNKIWFITFNKDGLDGPSMIDISQKDFEANLKKEKHVWFLKDFASEDEMYTAIKACGIGKFYTKKWFHENFNFLESQLYKL